MFRRRHSRAVTALVLGALAVYVLAPVFVVLEYAFAEKWFPSHWWFPQELGWKWFREMFTVGNIMVTIGLSYWIAFWVTMSTLVICVLAGYAMGSRAFRQQSGAATRFMEAFVNIPLAFPAIALGIGLLPVFAQLGLLKSVAGIVLAHMVTAVPYALRSIVGAFLLVPPELEEAARNLGAGRFYTLRRVHLPLVWPGIVGGAVFAFTWSLNEFVLTLLLGYPTVETIPVRIYHYIGGYYLSPNSAAALSLFLLLPTLVFMYLTEKALKAGGVISVGG
jgi:ABC-type spermidine/putrescine transport system permease subunit II